MAEVMTVAELVERLKRAPQDMEVFEPFVPGQRFTVIQGGSIGTYRIAIQLKYGREMYALEPAADVDA